MPNLEAEMLMMALLRLWATKNQPGLKRLLVYNGR
jgi:hypothetical protein